METALNPKLLDVVEVPNKFLGYETSGTTLGTVVEVFAEPPGHLLVEVADEGGVPQDLITVPTAELKVAWSRPRRDEESSPEGEASERFRRGVLLLQNGLIDEAKAEFRPAFELDPRLAGTLMNEATGRAKKNFYEQAILIYELILELQPENRLTKVNLASAYINRGVLHARRGALDKAIEDFSVPLTLDSPGDVSKLAQHNLVATYTQLGIRFAEIGRFKEASSHFFMALQVQPTATTRRNFAMALLSLQASKAEGAKRTPPNAAFNQHIRMGLSLSECLNAFGASLARIGDRESARNALERALRADPQNELARTNLALLQAPPETAGDWQLGLAAVELQPAAA